jgi:hypothetical protein
MAARAINRLRLSIGPEFLAVGDVGLKITFRADCFGKLVVSINEKTECSAATPAACLDDTMNGIATRLKLSQIRNYILVVSARPPLTFSLYRHNIYSVRPNSLRLSGARKGVRCSRGLGNRASLRRRNTRISHIGRSCSELQSHIWDRSNAARRSPAVTC